MLGLDDRRGLFQPMILCNRKSHHLCGHLTVPRETQESSSTDISSALSDSGMTEPLGKAASKHEGPQGEVFTELLDLGSIQGTWPIPAGASALKVKEDLLGTHTTNYLQF